MLPLKISQLYVAIDISHVNSSGCLYASYTKSPDKKKVIAKANRKSQQEDNSAGYVMPTITTDETFIVSSWERILLLVLGWKETRKVPPLSLQTQSPSILLLPIEGDILWSVKAKGQMIVTDQDTLSTLDMWGLEVMRLEKA